MQNFLNSIHFIVFNLFNHFIHLKGLFAWFLIHNNCYMLIFKCYHNDFDWLCCHLESFMTHCLTIIVILYNLMQLMTFVTILFYLDIFSLNFRILLIDLNILISYHSPSTSLFIRSHEVCHIKPSSNLEKLVNYLSHKQCLQS